MNVLLAIDTALQRAVVALGARDGSLVDQVGWVAGHRHGEELLPRLQELLRANDIELADVGGVIVGTGPGAFTGLRVGIATAKALAHGNGVPIAGVSTAQALLQAAELPGEAPPRALLLPAGPSDRVLVLDGRATLVPAGTELPEDLDAAGESSLVAVDLPDRAPAAALRRGEAAVAGLGAALVRIGAGRLARGDSDDLATLVPDYVTLPRGVASERGEVEWSHGLR